MPQSTEQFSGIFICYRREDSGGHAGRLYDRLVAHFGDEQTFMDLDRIEPGEDFVHVIERAVGSCEILLAVIGRSWLKSLDEMGRRRLDNPNDFVSVEIVAAFARDVRVIPVLVQGAQMPRAQDLPEALRPLSRRQAFDLSDQRWRQDVDRLVSTLDRILDRQREARRIAAEEEAERQRRETEARQRAEAEARQQAEMEAEARRRTEEIERRRRAAAETERRRLEAEASERLRREAEERERRAAEQAASAVIEIPEPAIESTSAHVIPAAKTLPAPVPSFDEDTEVTPAATRKPMSTSELTALFGIILCTVVFVVVFFFPSWRADETQLDANRNATPLETPQAEQSEATPTPTGTPLPPPGMVYVPGGEFMMGSNDGDMFEKPAHTVTVRPFFIDRYEVTNEEYAGFVKETGHKPPQMWTSGTYLNGTERRPVTGVTWYDANAYCMKVAGRRLPAEEEWEFAARGSRKEFRYPWGEKWRGGLANANAASSGLTDVGKYKGASPYGAFDMIGNAWEWTGSKLTPYPGGSLGVSVSDDLMVIRGGSFESKPEQATATYRGAWRASAARDYSKTGFRCAKGVGED